MFSALLKYWRGSRGYSQLDLALSAGVSARHVSFLETGRAKPSEEMILLLAATLDIPLRDRNELLRGAGFPPHFDEPKLDALEDQAVERTIAHMLAKHEPFPMMLLDPTYQILRVNRAATRLFGMVVKGELIGQNALIAFFDPEAGLRPFVVDWHDAARELIARVHRETLYHPHDERLAEVLKRLLAYPDVPKEWQRPDFSRKSAAVLPFRFRVGDIEVGFLTTMMKFNTPQNITIDELQIESYFPIDDVTEQLCMAMAAAADNS